MADALPPTLAAAIRSAAAPIAADEYTAQHGEVASAWQIYHAAGEPVTWKSGGTAGYGSFMVFNPSTGRAAVALGSCGNCGEKAVQQLARQLVDSPHVPVAPLPAPPSVAELEQVLGCYALPVTYTDDELVSGVGDPIVLSVAQVAGETLMLDVSGTDGSGSASLTPFAWPAAAGCSTLQCPLALALALRGNDTVLVRPGGVSGSRVAARGPLQAADLKHGRREVYFLPGAGGSRAAQAVLHVDGWDLFAARVPC